MSLLAAGLLTTVIFTPPVPEKSKGFSLKETGQGIELSENGNKVFFYQKATKESGKYLYNHYLHPVYNLKGEVITEEFPADHLNHRGIFWSWHQLFINEKSIGDGWMLENISQEVAGVVTKVNRKSARFKFRVLWKSSAWEDGKPFVEEESTVIVHKLEQGIRKIDFEISLKSLVPGVQVGGSNDEKG